MRCQMIQVQVVVQAAAAGLIAATLRLSLGLGLDLCVWCPPQAAYTPRSGQDIASRHWTHSRGDRTSGLSRKCCFVSVHQRCQVARDWRLEGKGRLTDL